MEDAARWSTCSKSRMSSSSRGFRHDLAMRLAIAALCCVWATSAQAQNAQPAVPQSSPIPQAPSGPAVPPPASPATRKPPPEPQFFVVIDPAHGGTDNGAMLSSDMPEKNYTLALAARLRTLLNARGIHSVPTRSSDISVDDTTRAVIANRAHAAACILLHATATGNGVHLFTSSLSPPAKPELPGPHRSFLSWQTAQASYVTESLRLESDVNAALVKQRIPVLLNRTALMPLDSFACPALAIEIAPLTADTPLFDAAYRQKIEQALVSALVAWHGDWRSQP